MSSSLSIPFYLTIAKISETHKLTRSDFWLYCIKKNKIPLLKNQRLCQYEFGLPGVTTNLQQTNLAKAQGEKHFRFHQPPCPSRAQCLVYPFLPERALSPPLSLFFPNIAPCWAQPIRAYGAWLLFSVGQGLLKRKRCFPERRGVALLCARRTVLGFGSE